MNTAQSSRNGRRRERALPSLLQMPGPPQKTRDGVSGAGSLRLKETDRRGRLGTREKTEGSAGGGCGGGTRGSARLVTSHHSLGYEPAVYGLQVRVPTFTSLLGRGQKSPRKESHSKTRGKEGNSTCRGNRKATVRAGPPSPEELGPSGPPPKHALTSWIKEEAFSNRDPKRVTHT